MYIDILLIVWLIIETTAKIMLLWNIIVKIFSFYDYFRIFSVYDYEYSPFMILGQDHLLSLCTLIKSIFWLPSLLLSVHWHSTKENHLVHSFIMAAYFCKLCQHETSMLSCRMIMLTCKVCMLKCDFEMLYVSMIMLHADTNKWHVKIIMLHVDITFMYLAYMK